MASEEIRADLLLGRDTLSPGLIKAGKAADDTAGNVKQLTRDLYELGKQRATPIVDLNDKTAEAKLAEVSAKLKELGAKVADPQIDLDDKKAAAGLADMRVKLDALGKKVSSPRITLEGLARAEAGILRLDAMLEDLDRKHASATVGVHRSFLSRIFGGGGGGGGGLLGGAAGAEGGGLLGLIRGIPGVAGAAPLSAQAVGIGGLAGVAALLTPALLPTLLGGGIGLGAGAGALALGSAGAAKLQADRQALARAQASLAGPGRGSASQRLTLQIAQQNLARDRSQYGPLQPLTQAFGGIKEAGMDTFLKALTGTGQGFSGHPGGESFASGLAGILKQIAGFIKSIGPQLGDMFRAALPFVSAFVKFLEHAAKDLLPALTQLLNNFVSSGALKTVTQGLVIIVKGFAGFLNAIGPSGMKAAARIFVIFAEAIAGALTGIGHALNWLAENTPKWIRFITNTFRTWRHETAVIFDGVRHDIAHIWDMVWNNTIGRLERGIRDFYHLGAQFRHSIANQFDSIRHDIATIWDTIWRNTVTRVQHGISDVVGWFKGLPGRAIRALDGLGTMLYNFGHMALTKLWNGLKAVFSSVWSWFKSLPGKLLNAIGIHSPPDWAISAGKHIMGGLLHGIISRKDELLTRFREISQGMGGVAGMKTGPVGGSVLTWILAAMRATNSPASWLPALQRIVMLESGGNPGAVNPTAIAGGQHASGLWQMLPSTFYAYGGRGSLFNPVGEGIAALRYIRSRYGSPFNIPGLFSGGYRGYASGGWITEPILGIGRSGRAYGFGERGPELVTPGGRAGGNTYNINVNVAPTGNLREAGRVTVQAIKAYEQGSGSGWRR